MLDARYINYFDNLFGGAGLFNLSSHIFLIQMLHVSDIFDDLYVDNIQDENDDQDEEGDLVQYILKRRWETR